MPTYRLLKAARIPIEPGARPARHPAGTIVEYDGEPSANLEPVDDAARAAVVAFAETRRPGKWEEMAKACARTGNHHRARWLRSLKEQTAEWRRNQVEG